MDETSTLPSGSRGAPGTAGTPGTSGPTGSPGSSTPPRRDGYERIRDLGIERDPDGKWLAGVCTGLARRLDVDPILLRAGFVALCFVGGLGLGLYLLAWALLPDADGEILIEGGVHRSRALGIFLLVVGVLALIDAVTPRWGGHGGIWVPVAIVLGFVVWNAMRSEGAQAASQSAVTTYQDPAAERALIADAPARVARPAAPNRPARQPRPARPPRRPTGGMPAFLVTVGLAILAFVAATTAADRYQWTGYPAGYGLAAALAAIGLVLIVKGALGMRSGAAIAVAIPTAIALAIASAAPAGIDIPPGTGTRHWAPNGTAYQSVRLGIGEGILDLTQPTAATATPTTTPMNTTTPTNTTNTATVQTIDATVGVGHLRILVPAGTATRIESTVLLGNYCIGRGPCDDTGRELHDTFTVGTGPATVIVHAKVSIGAITIEKG